MTSPDFAPEPPRSSSWAWWLHHAKTDPEDFEAECRRLITERPPCRACGAHEYPTPGSITITHDRNLHGADRVTPHKRAPSYQNSPPSRIAHDPLNAL
jgi:hypothetical protein